MPKVSQSISHVEGQAKRQYTPALFGFFVRFVDRKMWSEDGSAPAGDWDARRLYGFSHFLSAAPAKAIECLVRRILCHPSEFLVYVKPTDSLLPQESRPLTLGRITAITGLAYKCGHLAFLPENDRILRCCRLLPEILDTPALHLTPWGIWGRYALFHKGSDQEHGYGAT